MRDLHATAMDIPEEDLGEHIRRRSGTFNLTAFRLVNVVMFGLIVVAELMAIY